MLVASKIQLMPILIQLALYFINLKCQITQEKYNEIKNHGDQLLKQFGLSKITYPSQEVFISANWQLDFNGNKYQNNNYAKPFLITRTQPDTIYNLQFFVDPSQ